MSHGCARVNETAIPALRSISEQCLVSARSFLFCSADMQCEKTAAFSLQSILNQVLKPLDVKTKFYNAEVSVS